MSWYGNYIGNIAQNPEEYYREQTQAWIDDYFDDTTLLRNIQEEEYPFNGVYKDYEVHIDSVAEITVNINKVIGDFISVIFKDCEHQNYRGQKYIYDNDIYLCYDKINYLTKVAKTNLIRCNNEIVWIDNNGNIQKEDVFLGYEISSTNDSISKKGIVSNRRLLLYMQYNDKTKSIKLNQRFMFQHSQCFRVEEIDDYNRESKTNQNTTMIKMYLVYSPILPQDNTELNICDYDKVDFKIKINEGNISQINGFNGILTHSLTNHSDISNEEVIWESDNDQVVVIDNYGNYSIIGQVGEFADIKCYMKNNVNVYDIITIEVVNSYLPIKEIIVSPNNIKSIREKESIKFDCGVYIEGQKQSDIVTCNVIGNPNSYKIENINNIYTITNVHFDNQPIKLIFSATDCDNVEIEIKFIGLI